MGLKRLVVPILLSTVLMLIPSYVYVGQGQTTTTSTTARQCIDFNQDKICEFILLANGTMMKNPRLSGQPTTETTSKRPQTTDFLSYGNPTLGIRTQYPSDWQLEEEDDEVKFVQQKDIVSLEANVDENVDSTLSQYANMRLNELREQRQDFKLIELTPTTISGNPAQKVVYTFVKDDGPRAGEINKVMRIWTIKDDKLYTVAYISELDKFPDYLPLVERMVDSFRLGTVR